MITRKCLICHITFTVKRISDLSRYFHKSKRYKIGFRGDCKDCRHSETIRNRQAKAKYDKERYIVSSKILTVCPICKDDFLPRNTQQKLCGKKECRKKWKYITDKARREVNKRRKNEN